MANMDPCGKGFRDETTGFLPEYEDVNQFMQQTLKAVLQATKASNEMPSAGDDFDYYSSFQGFQDAMDTEGKRILHMIQSILKQQNVKVHMGSTSGAADIEDKLDVLMDANDQILERVGTWLDEASGIKKDDSSLVVAQATPKQQPAASWNKKSPGAGARASPSFRLLSARNIQRPQLRFKDKVDNRSSPFVPILREKCHALRSLEESLQVPVDAETDDPKFLYPHPYKYEIDKLQYFPDQICPAKLQEMTDVNGSPLTFVVSTEDLQSLVAELKKHTEMAVDLEHHSYRTFQGITCLLQISTRSQDYLIDTLELRSEMHHLNEVFTDPKIVKVFHGADSDIDWLQRDFGVYVVNMFDTGQAARVMGHTRFSLAHLLQHYCDVIADKKYQLADWRISQGKLMPNRQTVQTLIRQLLQELSELGLHCLQKALKVVCMRPLPEELQKYAREDTHYLLYIYDRMKNELIERGNENKNLLLSVLQRSSQVCLKVYKKPSFSEEDYKELYRKNKKVFNSRQMLALKEVYAWRDETARLEDESYGRKTLAKQILWANSTDPNQTAPSGSMYTLFAKTLKLVYMRYVLPNHMMLQICDILPRERQGILACCNPIPPLVRQYLNELHIIINKAREAPLEKIEMHRPQKPVPSKHHIVDVTSLLHCPHDMSHLNTQGITSTTPLLLDSSGKSTVVGIPNSVFVTTSKPLLTVFDTTIQQPSCGDEVRKKVASIKASFLSLYSQYLPEDGNKSVLKPAKLVNIKATTVVPVTVENTWKLLPKTAKRKERQTSGEQQTTSDAPPAKRSRTNLHEEKKKPALTEDDKKALPPDIDTPLRFQVSAEKKKKKNRNRDVDILESVQKHLANIRKLQEANEEQALGQEPIHVDAVDDSSGTSALTSVKPSESGSVKDSKKVKKGNKNKAKGGSETEVIDVDKEDSNGNAEFKPYDYTTAARQVLQGKSGPKLDYFDPQSQMRKRKGPRVSKNKSYKKQGKSFTWKS